MGPGLEVESGRVGSNARPLAAAAALERVPVTQDVRASAKAELAAIAKVLRDGKPRAQSRSSIEGAFGPAPALTAEQLTGI
jgi:hypothetical protein